MRLRSTPEGRAQLASRVTVEGTSTCYGDIGIQSSANGLWVSAELGYPGTYDPAPGNFKGVLRARAAEIGPWELFTNCVYQDSAGRWVTSYRSVANGLWVSTEYGWKDWNGGTYYEVLRARASQAGTWEHYYEGDGPCTFGWRIETVYIGRYVSVELGYPGTYDSGPGNYKGVLRGRATTLGPWEVFGYCPDN